MHNSLNALAQTGDRNGLHRSFMSDTTDEGDEGDADDGTNTVGQPTTPRVVQQTTRASSAVTAQSVTKVSNVSMNAAAPASPASTMLPLSLANLQTSHQQQHKMLLQQQQAHQQKRMQELEDRLAKELRQKQGQAEQQQLLAMQHHEQLLQLAQQSKSVMEREHEDALRAAGERHRAVELGLKMQVEDLAHQLELQKQLQADAQAAAQQSNEEMQRRVGSEMATMVAHMTESNEVLSAHFDESQREKEALARAHEEAEKVWRQEMERLSQSYKMLMSDAKKRHSVEQEAALDTLSELRKSQGGTLDRVREYADLQQTHESALAQLQVLQKECEQLRGELRASAGLRAELAAAHDELRAVKEDARMAAVQARLKEEHATVVAGEQTRKVAELTSRIQTMRLQQDGLRHRLDLATINNGGSIDPEAVPDPSSSPATTHTQQQAQLLESTSAAQATAEAEVRDLRGENERLQTQLKHVEKLRATLMREVEDRGKAGVEEARRHAEEKEQLRTEWQKKVRSLETALTSAMGNAAAWSSDETARMQELINEASDLRQEVLAQRTAAAREAEHHRGVLAENNHLLAQARAEVKQLEDQLKDANATKTTLENELKAERENVARWKYEATHAFASPRHDRDAQQQQQKLAGDLAESQRQVQDMENKISRLEQELKVARETASSMVPHPDETQPHQAGDDATAKEEVASLRAELGWLKKEMRSEVEAERTIAVAASEEADKMVADAAATQTATVRALEDRMEAARVQLEVERKSLQAAEKQLQQLKSEQADWQQQEVLHQQEIKRLKKEVEDTRKDTSAAQARGLEEQDLRQKAEAAHNLENSERDAREQQLQDRADKLEKQAQQALRRAEEAEAALKAVQRENSTGKEVATNSSGSPSNNDGASPKKMSPKKRFGSMLRAAAKDGSLQKAVDKMETELGEPEPKPEPEPEPESELKTQPPDTTGVKPKPKFNLRSKFGSMMRAAAKDGSLQKAVDKMEKDLAAPTEPVAREVTEEEFEVAAKNMQFEDAESPSLPSSFSSSPSPSTGPDMFTMREITEAAFEDMFGNPDTGDGGGDSDSRPGVGCEKAKQPEDQ